MFTLEAMQALLDAKPFIPFRLWMSDGGAVDVRHRELALLGRRFSVVGLPDPGATDTLFDRWAVVWYMHVTRVEMLGSGAPPFSAPPEPTGQPSPSST